MKRIRELLVAHQWSRPSPSLLDATTNKRAQTCPICCSLKKYGVHDEECWLGQAITLLEKQATNLDTQKVHDGILKQNLEAGLSTAALVTQNRELKSELEGKEDAWHEAMYQLKVRVVKTFEWLVEDTKNKSEGGYTPKLTEAIALLEELKGATNAS